MSARQRLRPGRHSPLRCAIRATLRTVYGDGKYRITRGGEIHVYGQMPNSIVTGWWLFGHVTEAETLERITALCSTGGAA